MYVTDTLLFDMYFALWPLGGDTLDFITAELRRSVAAV